MTASFIIFTMQTGFGMLESGCVSIKNESNIMVKNLIDVVLGGFTYWMFGKFYQIRLVASYFSINFFRLWFIIWKRIFYKLVCCIGRFFSWSRHSRPVDGSYFCGFFVSIVIFNYCDDHRFWKFGWKVIEIWYFAL